MKQLSIIKTVSAILLFLITASLLPDQNAGSVNRLKLIIFDFRNESNTADLAYLSAALPSTLSARLLSGLTEIIENINWKGAGKKDMVDITDQTAARVAQKSGASVFITGTFSKMEDGNISIKTFLYDTEKPESGETFIETAPETDIFKSIDIIAGKIEENLSVFSKDNKTAPAEKESAVKKQKILIQSSDPYTVSVWNQRRTGRNFIGLGIPTMSIGLLLSIMMPAQWIPSSLYLSYTGAFISIVAGGAALAVSGTIFFILGIVKFTTNSKKIREENLFSGFPEKRTLTILRQQDNGIKNDNNSDIFITSFQYCSRF